MSFDGINYKNVNSTLTLSLVIVKSVSHSIVRGVQVIVLVITEHTDLD